MRQERALQFRQARDGIHLLRHTAAAHRVIDISGDPGLLCQCIADDRRQIGGVGRFGVKRTLHKGLVDLIGTRLQLSHHAAPGGDSRQIDQGHLLVLQVLQDGCLTELPLVVDVRKLLQLRRVMPQLPLAQFLLAFKQCNLGRCGTGIDN